MRRRLVAALLVGCCTLVSCGTKRADTARDDSPAPRSTVIDKACDVENPPQDTNDDQGLPDTTTDDQGLPDTTTDDQGLPDTTTDDQELPDTTTDDQELPDTTTDDQGAPAGDTTEDGADVPGAGPHRWFSMAREFRAYLMASAPKGDAAIAAHVTRVCVRTPDDSGRTEADVWVDYGVWQDDELNDAAKAFVHWRRSVYGDHGHVTALAPAKMDTELSW
ncbi:hypothetical protein GCM10010260_21130 [Streptomyces filipinensis]|uniref:Lipoprotein n=2 Tax=Streptomyces filipinensis TaxID=66887 RepID=A0A918I906_9ACTN|nr:hypothetical protein GCM10010260_21130 [Streptomyces filipinensis]